MAGSRMGKELLVKTKNKVGMLAEVTAAIAATGVNIQGICAYGEDGEACFLIVTDDNMKAEGTLKGKNYKVKERDVVIVDLENKAGAAKEMATKLKKADIDLNYMYGTTHGTGVATVVFSSNNNAKAFKAVK